MCAGAYALTLFRRLRGKRECRKRLFARGIPVFSSFRWRAPCGIADDVTTSEGRSARKNERWNGNVTLTLCRNGRIPSIGDFSRSSSDIMWLTKHPARSRKNYTSAKKLFGPQRPSGSCFEIDSAVDAMERLTPTEHGQTVRGGNDNGNGSGGSGTTKKQICTRRRSRSLSLSLFFSTLLRARTRFYGT